VAVNPAGAVMGIASSPARMAAITAAGGSTSGVSPPGLSPATKASCSGLGIAHSFLDSVVIVIGFSLWIALAASQVFTNSRE